MRVARLTRQPKIIFVTHHPLEFVSEVALITESEVERSFRKLIKASSLNQETLDKAETLLEELRPESPLRHRLAQEIDELREMSQA